LAVRDIGFGFDQFGMEKESVWLGYVVARLLYKHWFRVDSAGHENIPLTGRALLTPNHSGVLPIDGAMIWCDLLHKLPRPRSMRAVVDNFMGFLPFISTMMYRTGQVVGARRNFQDLLEAEELVTVFPEGAKGTGKPFKDRYRLIPFNVGFVELSLSYRAPIIPTAVVGGEEQAPMLYDLKPIARLLAFPYFPVTPFFPLLGPLGVIPLPVKYHIRYGRPLRFYEEYPPETVHQPEIVRRLAEQVQATVDEMLRDGLRRRKSVFGFQ
jgi:1-acyl-sn-glycerol-3-phosphate acyltransferase